jgi:3-carboxy-cis,cis-muconate cycloisomerase
MRPFSSKSEGLLDPLFASPDVEAHLGDEALLQAMLDAESALARAEADAGVVPAAAAEAIANACRDGDFDIAALGDTAQAAGNPVVPLVRALVAAVPESARPFVHHGATSQDIVDTALMLLVKRAGAAVCRDGVDAAAGCAALAERHRDTVMLARTLGQQASVTTFGLKSAGWLVAVADATRQLSDVLDRDLAVQFGGASGTLGVLGAAGPGVVDRMAEMLGLTAPVVPWHTDRQRIVRIAAALGGVVAAAGKVALDVVLLAQSEVGEVREGGGGGHGGSSALPHKHNPVDAVLVRSAAFRAPGLVSILLAASQHEHERAAGGWHAEWETLRELVSITGGALGRLCRLLRGLDVRAVRMAENLSNAGDIVLAESLAGMLAPLLGRTRAQRAVTACCARAVEHGRTLREVAITDDEVRAHLSASDIDNALQPTAMLGAVGMLIDRALARWSA